MALFKFVSSGQAVADATVFSQVLRGNSLKPLAPANIRGYRDSSNNLLIEWTRRSRIGAGLRPSTDVPIAEESATYLVEIYSGATLIRSQTVSTSELQDQPVQWQKVAITATTPTQDTFGTLSFPNPTTDSAMRSVQRLSGDFIFSFSLDDVGSAMPGIVAIRPYGNETIGSQDAVQNTPSIILDSADQALAADFTYPIRYYFVRRGSEIRIYQDDPTSTPILICHKQFLGIYSIYASQTGSPGTEVIYRPRLTIGDPGWLYTAGMQTNDGLIPGNPVSVRLYQISAVIGIGPYTAATL